MKRGFYRTGDRPGTSQNNPESWGWNSPGLFLVLHTLHKKAAAVARALKGDQSSEKSTLFCVHYCFDWLEVNQEFTSLTNQLQQKKGKASTYCFLKPKQLANLMEQITTKAPISAKRGKP